MGQATSARTDVTINADGSPAQPGITLYGASWCSDTRRSKALLNRFELPYTDIDIDASDPAATAWIAAQNGGERRLPTIVLASDLPLLFEPSDDELQAALEAAGYVEPAVAGR